MQKSCHYMLAILVAFVSFSLQAMVYDNRFFPLIEHPFITADCRPSHLRLEGFITTSDRGFGHNEEEIGIPVLFGAYDQRELARAMIIAGFPPPLRSSFLFNEIPWNMEGKLQSQGFDLEYRQSFCDWLAVGMSMLIMRSDSRITFICNADKVQVTAEERNELADAMRAMHERIGLNCSHAHQAGFGDFDLYARVSHCWDYTCKFRKIDVGARLGMLAPTGVRRDINIPASVAFGGNGHWGIYGMADAEFELKEDWKVGALARVSKRFARSCLTRMPVCKEPQLFGAVVGQARVVPGPTLALSVYAALENLREGFGVRVQYTWTEHGKDCVLDERCNKTVPVNLAPLVDFSSWRSSYVTLAAFYDFGKVKACRQFDPIFVFNWDVPVNFFDAHGVVKTNKVSLGVEFNF